MNNKFLQIFKNVFFNKNQNSNIKRDIIVAKDEDHLKNLIENEIKKYGNECDLNHINVSKVANMGSLFFKSKFNGDISKWNVSNVKNMSDMFSCSEFNSDISMWDVGNVNSMLNMFYGSLFNRDISQWDVSNVENMLGMFNNSKFNGSISSWDVSNVTSMQSMFKESKFSGDIDDWKPYKADMSNMFKDVVIPYWYSYNNLDENERKLAIEHYIEKKALNERLNVSLDSKITITRNKL